MRRGGLMGDLLQSAGLLGVATPLGANVSLVVMLVAAVLFTIGWRLAVRKQFDAHRWVQTVAVCLNASLVLAWMVRYFVLYIVPELSLIHISEPTRLGMISYAVFCLKKKKYKKQDMLRIQ